MTTEKPHDTFPRQHARTQRFTAGAPRSFTVGPDGERVLFLRSHGVEQPANLLWSLDVASGVETVLADPAELLGGGAEQLSAAERARRERSRETSAGIVGYALDAAGRTAAFALSGRLFAVDTATGEARELPAATPLLDPRPSPDGRLVGYATPGGELRVTAADGSGDRLLAGPEADGVSWGQAEFVAQEEMSRDRGYWWAPDSSALLAARVDDRPVQRWWIADPANPERPPVEVAYPAAGTPNAEVGLWLLGLDGSRTEIRWDRAAYPYLARVHWSAGGPPLLQVQARDQREQLVLEADLTTGGTTVLLTERDPDWLELFGGVPVRRADGELVRIADRDGVRVLLVGEQAVTDADLHVRSVLAVDGDGVLFAASAGAAEFERRPPGWLGVFTAGPDGVREVGEGALGAVRGGGTTVLTTADPLRPGTTVTVLRAGVEPRVIASHAATPLITARPVFRFAGERRIPCAVLLPTGYDPDVDGELPVLMDPYGGPHGQRVVQAHNPHLVSQWFADQGFAVIVADGRGTPGHSPAWEKSINRRTAEITVADQVDALHALAEQFPLDLTRVAIRGWSYGGYLAAAAVLREPEVFHAAVAGAPVTEHDLYDTHYTERYYGDPNTEPEAYRANSVVELAPTLRRPLMIVHGLADDNVVVAHSLRLSTALLAAGRPHTVLPLSGVTHMTPQEQVAENLLLLQVRFLKEALGLL
ncbi:S9 family peptidase [Streptomyces sp. TLI_171]|uniref:S9 family peptidase n=1 Tax=Streptomyces sp. TLI_171 TaxID=1938859 RepID=UPI000C19370F|nr:alpha/beta fold hydrolase [Streptomyces sp. TLI_171]RKE20971.1 dipeptidyl-peptidase-4 [Streptomyces sp. TLI_171]